MNLGAPEIIIIAIVIFALFGYKKLPDATRAIGRSLRIFKGEMKGFKEDGVETKAEAQTVRSPLPPATPSYTETQQPAQPAYTEAQPTQPAAQPAPQQATPMPAAPPAQPAPYVVPSQQPASEPAPAYNPQTQPRG